MNIPAFLVYCAIIAVTPGPNTRMSLYLGASGGSRFWRFFAGSMAGLLVKCALCGLLNVLLSEKIPALVPYLKWLGALYMLYLAFGMVRSGLKPAGDDQRSGEGSFQSWRQSDKSWNGKSFSRWYYCGGHRKRCIYWRQSIKATSGR